MRTRSDALYSSAFCTPRLSWQSCKMPPTTSDGVSTMAVITGSSILSICPSSGSFAGLSISITVPSVVVTRYNTPGAVVTRSLWNWATRRSCSRRAPQVPLELALEALLHDLHVEEAEESTAEPEAEGDRCLRFEEERRVVQPQLLERLSQLGIAVSLDRIQTCEHHRLERPEAGVRFRRR